MSARSDGEAGLTDLSYPVQRVIDFESCAKYRSTCQLELEPQHFTRSVPSSLSPGS